MLKTTGIRLAIAAVTFLAVSCAATKPNEFLNDDGLLGYVPADSPYVFAAVEPIPDDVLDAWEPKLEKVLESYRRVMRELLRMSVAKNTGGETAEGLQRMSRVADEFMSLMSIDGMRGAGIARDSGLVFFGHGLLPVLRIDLSDPDLFEAAVARMEAAAGAALSTAEIDGVRYRYVGDQNFQLIIGIFDGDAVFTALPGNFGNDELRQLTGLIRPDASIAQSGALDVVATEYALLPQFAGFIDATRVAETILMTPGGLDAILLEGTAPAASKLSDVCKSEVLDLVGIAPRIVFGYTGVEKDSSASLTVVELREDIALGLSTLAAIVPGLGIDHGGLVSFGMSFDLQALKDFIEARLDAVQAEPFQCEHLVMADSGVAKLRDALAQPVPPFVYQLRGFNMIVDEMEGLDLANEQPPTSVDASLLLAMDDAEAMLAVAAMFSPQLAQLDLQPDRTPARLELPQLANIAEAAFVAMADNAIALSVGADAEARAAAVLDAAEPVQPPFMSASMDASEYYKLVAAGMMEDASEGEESLPLEIREALRDAMLATGDLYDRLSGHLMFTPRGIELISTVTFNSE